MNYGSSFVVSPHQPAPEVEARLTAPDDPGGGSGSRRGALAYAYGVLGVGEEWRDSRMDPDRAMTLSAFWAAVGVISQSLACVNWHVFERSADGRSKMEIEDNESWLLGLQANPEMKAFDWREVMLKDALTWGNGYSEIERTSAGRPAWLWRIDPSRVTPVRDDDGSLWYEVGNGSGKRPSYLPAADVFHLKGPSPDGVVGYSVVHMARRSIQLGLATEKFGASFFERGPVPGGIVTVPAKMNDEQRATFRRSFEKLYAGSGNAHRVVVLSDGVTFDPASLPNDDAQFLESRLFQVGDIARWFRLPPHKIGDLSRATFSNIEHQERQFVADALLPWARRLEGEADVKLYGAVRRGRRFTRLDLDALQQGDSQAQTATVTQKVNSGLYTHNEGREHFGLNPVEGGDTLLVQGAMVRLDQVVNPPEPPPAPAPVPTPDVEASRRPGVRAAFAPLLADAYGRLLRVDADKAERAAKKGRLPEHVAAYYGDGAAARVAAELLPTFRALASVAGTGDPGALADAAAGRHVERCRAGLAARGVEALAGWQGVAAEAADDDLRGVPG